MRHPRFLSAAIAVLLAGVAAACDSAPESDSVVKKGGTVRVIVSGLPRHMDPQKISAAMDANFSRLMTRTLTTFKSAKAPEGGELVRDLATDLGRPSENNKVWEFTIREGVKWQDGTAIQCSHLKYGVERNFSSLVGIGLPYARMFLVDNAVKYTGPFGDNNKGAGLESVQCLDQRVIQFRLKQSVGDFNYAVALPIFAPVKPGENKDESDQGYDKAPMSNGPYRVKPGGRTESEVTLIRNEHWSESVDSVRKAYPEQIIIKADVDTPAVTNAIIQDQGMDANTLMLQRDVAPNFLQQVLNDPALLARTATGPSGAVRYFSINTKLIKDVRCRKALEYGFNKRRYRQAMGGSLMGELATTMLPPTLTARQDFDHYSTKSTGGDGDEEQALALIKEAKDDGVTCPTELKVSHPDNPTIERFVRTLVDAYLRIGIKVTLVKLPDDTYFDDVRDAGVPFHLIYFGWVPDFSNGSAVIPALFKGTEVRPAGEIGGSNTSFLENAEVDKLIDEALAEFNVERQRKLWAELDSKLSQLAVTIPVLYPNAIRLHGSNMANVFVHPAFGSPDMCALGLINPSASTGT